MKVLHIPLNVASQASVIVRALKDIGIDARVLVKNNPMFSDSHEVETLPSLTAGRYSPKRGLQKIQRWQKALNAIRWADVIHWHSSSHVLPMNLDLRYAAYLNKARFVEFWGTDTRIPAIAIENNPYIKDILPLDKQLLQNAADKSINIQRRFCKHGFECILAGYTHHVHIQRDIFPTIHKTNQRLILADYEPHYPLIAKQRPLIIHTPSLMKTKGTETILAAVNKLKESFEFDFQLVHGVSHKDALARMKQCDIMVDQLVIGEHGIAATESMAFGKPTVCYIQPSFISMYPAELPIVNASQDTIEHVLADLIADSRKRHEIGRQSRAYVEKYHDAHKVARGLVEIYEGMLKKCKKS